MHLHEWLKKAIFEGFYVMLDMSEIVRKELIVKPGTYVPRPESDYPDDPSERLVKVLVEDSSTGRFQFDETYPYVDRSFGFWLKYNFQRIGRFGLNLADRLIIGLKVKGKSNLKGCRKAFKGGAMMISNHVFRHDAALSYTNICPWKNVRIPMFAKHFNDPSNYFWMRYVGGIPIPETRAGIAKFDEALEYYHSKGDWFLIFPEAVRWDFYTAIRPFQKGAFNIAYKFDIPVIPCVISYRERKGIYKWFGPAEKPLMTLNVCKPLFPDRTKPRKVEVERLRNETHAAMVEAAGILQNPWPAKPFNE